MMYISFPRPLRILVVSPVKISFLWIAWLSIIALGVILPSSSNGGSKSYDFGIWLNQPHPFTDSNVSQLTQSDSDQPSGTGGSIAVLNFGDSVHDYTVRLRPGVWLAFVEGEYKTVTSRGRDVSITIDGDLGYDKPYETFQGEASLRWRRHDFWITGMAFDQSESAPINVEFVLDGETFNLGGSVDSEASITDINFRYGYSFFDFEKDGFRLGPTVAVSYTDISLEVTELTVAGIPTGSRLRFEDTLPVPTIGFHLEVPYNSFLFSTQFGGFYFETGDIEATGIRAEAGVTWRPYDNVGFFAGLNAIYVDMELSGEEIDDLLFWGPVIGLEIRF